LIALLLVGGLAVLLLFLVGKMPPLGEPDNPARQGMAARYLEDSEQDTQALDVVTAVHINYRGYDTLGKLAIIYAALAGVLAVLGRERRGRLMAKLDGSAVRPSVIVSMMVRFVIPFIVLFSAYLIIHADLTPGGGFQGGAVIGASMIIFTTIFGLREASGRIFQGLRVPLEGAAILIFFILGVLGLAGGGNFLTYAWPGVASSVQPGLVTWLSAIAEIGIGLGIGLALISILFAMMREGDDLEPLA
jgi:multicomponent Na+:H+ antiporter subunit B